MDNSNLPTPAEQQAPNPYENPAFQDLLRKVIATPKDEVERGLAAEQAQRQAKHKPK